MYSILWNFIKSQMNKPMSMHSNINLLKSVEAIKNLIKSYKIWSILLIKIFFANKKLNEKQHKMNWITIKQINGMLVIVIGHNYVD